MLKVVNLSRERRRRLGLKKELELVGLDSSARTILAAALSAADPEDRELLFSRATKSSYAAMIATVVDHFEVPSLTKTQAVN